MKNSIIKYFKTLLSLVLVLTLVLSTVDMGGVVTAKAEGLPDEVTAATKTATPVQDSNGTEAEIEFNFTVGSTTQEETQYKETRIVLVIDRSDSMRGNKLANVKSAANEFAGKMLKPTSEGGYGLSGYVQIAVVSYAQTASTVQNFSNNYLTIASAISGISVVGWNNPQTNIQAGIYQARTLLAEAENKSGKANEVIILLSDSEPNRSYKGNAYNNAGEITGYSYTDSDIVSNSSYTIQGQQITLTLDMTWSREGYTWSNGQIMKMTNEVSIVSGSAQKRVSGHGNDAQYDYYEWKTAGSDGPGWYETSNGEFYSSTWADFRLTNITASKATYSYDTSQISVTPDHYAAAKFEADLAKTEGATIYTIAYDANTTATALMSAIATQVPANAPEGTKYAYTSGQSASAIAAVFNSLSEAIKVTVSLRGTGAELVDQMSSYYEVDLNTISATKAGTSVTLVAGEDYTYADGVFTWKIGDLMAGSYVLSYTVKMKDTVKAADIATNCTAKSEGSSTYLVPTNNNAVLKYAATGENGASVKYTFVDSKVEVEVYSYTVEYNVETVEGVVGPTKKILDKTGYVFKGSESVDIMGLMSYEQIIAAAELEKQAENVKGTADQYYSASKVTIEPKNNNAAITDKKATINGDGAVIAVNVPATAYKYTINYIVGGLPDKTSPTTVDPEVGYCYDKGRVAISPMDPILARAQVSEADYKFYISQRTESVRSIVVRRGTEWYAEITGDNAVIDVKFLPTTFKYTINYIVEGNDDSIMPTKPSIPVIGYFSLSDSMVVELLSKNAILTNAFGTAAVPTEAYTQCENATIKVVKGARINGNTVTIDPFLSSNAVINVTVPINKYNVNYYKENGTSSIESVEVKHGASHSLKAGYDKDSDYKYAYTFQGWVDMDDTTEAVKRVGESVTVNADMNYKAKFIDEPRAYTVIFHAYALGTEGVTGVSLDPNDMAELTFNNVLADTVLTQDDALKNKIPENALTDSFKTMFADKIEFYPDAPVLEGQAVADSHIEFTGWNRDLSDPITGDTNIYANYLGTKAYYDVILMDGDNQIDLMRFAYDATAETQDSLAKIYAEFFAKKDVKIGTLKTKSDSDYGYTLAGFTSTVNSATYNFDTSYNLTSGSGLDNVSVDGNDIYINMNYERTKKVTITFVPVDTSENVERYTSEKLLPGTAGSIVINYSKVIHSDTERDTYTFDKWYLDDNFNTVAGYVSVGEAGTTYFTIPSDATDNITVYAKELRVHETKIVFKDETGTIFEGYETNFVSTNLYSDENVGAFVNAATQAAENRVNALETEHPENDYKFIGWEIVDEQGNIISESAASILDSSAAIGETDIIFRAKYSYELKEFDVTFMPEYSTVVPGVTTAIDTKTVKYGDTVNANEVVASKGSPEDPTVYTFTGWVYYDETTEEFLDVEATKEMFKSVTSNFTVYATYTVQHRVTFVDENGAFDPELSVLVADGTSFTSETEDGIKLLALQERARTAADATADGKRTETAQFYFRNWQMDNEDVVDFSSVSVDKPLTFVAKYTSNLAFVVTFHSDTPRDSAVYGVPVRVENGETVSAPGTNPTKASVTVGYQTTTYTFDGWIEWVEDADNPGTFIQSPEVDFTEPIIITSNRDFYPVWTENTTIYIPEIIPTIPSVSPTPVPTEAPTDTPTPTPEAEEVEAEIPDNPEGEPEEEAEPTEAPEEEVEVEEIETPEGDAEEELPKTGTAPVGIFYGIGAACIIIGGVIVLRFRRKEDEA